MSSLPIVLIAALLIASILGLLWSSDRFVAGAADIAIQLGVSPLVIGLTLVSIGTSAPEILVSMVAAFDGVPELAVGNALGSNLANTGLVLAATVLIISIPISKAILKSEMLVMFLVTIAAGAILFDGYLGRLECILLMGITPVFLYLSFKGGALPDPDEIISETIADSPAKPLVAWLWLLLGLVGLILSSNLLVQTAEETAMRAGVSELVIGVTVVAVGTSLPELAASLTSALKGKTDIALGNVLGSNVFNLLLVLPIAGIISPTQIGAEAFNRDFGTLMLMTLALVAFCIVGLRGSRKTFYLGKGFGALLLLSYIIYYYRVFA